MPPYLHPAGDRVSRGPPHVAGAVVPLRLVAAASIGFIGWMSWNTYLATPSGADPFLFRGGMFLVGLCTVAIIAAVAIHYIDELDDSDERDDSD